MKRSRITDDQITEMLKEHESGISIADVCRQYGISSTIFDKYKAKFDGLDAFLNRTFDYQ